MFVEELRRAVQVTPRHRLAEISAAVWKGFAAGAIGETEAQGLAEMIEARKVVPVAPSQPRRVGSRPRSSASLERRRSWAAGSWMPPAMAARFTTAENAALAVIIREIATTGSCGLAAAAIAGRAGISASSARNAVREARRRGVLHVEERRIRYDRNEPNLITIASRELALWVRTRARMSGQGGGIKSLTPTTNHILSSSARPVATGRTTETFGKVGRKVWATRAKEGGASTGPSRSRRLTYHRPSDQDIDG